MEDINPEIRRNLSEVTEALRKIASGDPDVRIDEASEMQIISELKHMVNLTARDIGEMVDQSHEFAMTLAEHFDVLHRVTKGKLDVRISGSSDVELMEALKKVTNETIESLSKEILDRRNVLSLLESTLESTADGILVVDSAGRLLKYNRKFIDMWHIPQTIAESHDDEKALAFIIDQLKYPDIFMKKVTELYADPDAESFDILEFRDGRVFERYSMPQTVDGTVTGRVWSFRDVTEQKRTEKALNESKEYYRITAEKLQKGKEAFFNMLADIRDSYKELEQLFLNLVSTMVNLLDAKSPWTKGHSVRVARYAEDIAKEMGLTEKELRDLHLAGLLHDIGKIGTYDVLLDKPGKLTDEEFAIVKKHPSQGAHILQGIKQLKSIIPLIRHHHERIDGRGYPDGLKGDEIPLGARILHVADSFDSMTADRPYRPSPGKEYAISEFNRCSGAQFDSQIVEVFLKVLSRE